jgi:hypothetical protein
LRIVAQPAKSGVGSNSAGPVRNTGMLLAASPLWQPRPYDARSCASVGSFKFAISVVWLPRPRLFGVKAFSPRLPLTRVPTHSTSRTPAAAGSVQSLHACNPR